MIVTFGDSTTASREGVWVYTDQLRERLPREAFHNAGVPGNTTEMARVRFEADVLAHRPRKVVIQFGINDSAVDVWKAPPATEPRVALPRYGENLRHFVAEVRRAGAEPVLMTPNPVRWTEKLRELYGKPPYEVAAPLGFDFLRSRYACEVRTVAREEGVPVVDICALYTAWEAVHGNACPRLLPDGMHPSTEGHTLVADALALRLV